MHYVINNNTPMTVVEIALNEAVTVIFCSHQNHPFGALMEPI